MAFDGILIHGASEILKKLVAVIGNEINLAWGVEDELKQLRDTLEFIDAKTSDAERKQMNDAEVSLWLKRLKEVSYDADDVLDEFSNKAMCPSDIKNIKVKDFFSSSSQVTFRLKMARRIEGINIKLQKIATDMKRFQFQTTYSTTGGYEQQRKRLTTSFCVGVSNIVGRKLDKSKIIKMLIPLPSSSVNSNLDEKISVISIVGIEGLGKTSLAQAIYNDESVRKQFLTKMSWVCTSDGFNVFKILKSILESFESSTCEDFSNCTDVLVKRVREELQGMKYLLVLDDLRNEDLTEWNKLKSVLDFGSVGSKIIVTTGSQKVASMVEGLIPPYNLNVLSEVECWSIIKNIAFSSGGASESPNMIILGEEIAKKCGGLPLAANFFGCFMHSQSDERHWLSIRDNINLELGNYNGGIIPILKLSYDTLPSHLKQCFLYCCLFPKDWRYNRQTLIQLWIAEGFINPSHGGNHNSLEDIGNDYFLSLLSSSFFHDVKRDDNSFDIETFKMHVLVHDLALSVVDSQEVMIHTSEIENDASKIRRLLLTTKGTPKTYFDVLNKATKLRSIFFQEEGFFNPNLLNNKRLRVVHRLGAGSSFQETPPPISSFGLKFKHMRYLDLSYSNLEDVHASESIHQLYNLQTLNLQSSQNVQNILKEGIGSLINLRHLDFSYSDANLLPDSITRLTNLQTLNINGCRDISVLPTNIGHLQNLSSLDISWTTIPELPDSICLLYNLTKFNFKGTTSFLKTLPRNFGALTQLRSLDLSETGITELPDSLTINICKLVFVKFGNRFIKFPQDIKNWVELRILEYWGNTDGIIMPRGIAKLTRLEVLSPYQLRKEDDVSINACSYNSSSSIHELAHLNSLRTLGIVNLENVRGGKIEAENAKLKDKQNITSLYLEWKSQEDVELAAAAATTVLEGLQPHRNLESLNIVGFPGLEFPKWMASSSCLPNLVQLHLYNCKSCENLVGLGQLPCLQTLWIQGMNSVKCLGKEFYYQQEVEEDGKDCSATTTTFFPSLIRFFILYSGNLEEWFAPPQPDNSFPCLEEVEIRRCSNLTSIPDLRLWTSSLRKLSIEGPVKLQKEPIAYYIDQFLPSVQFSWVDDIFNVPFVRTWV